MQTNLSKYLSTSISFFLIYFSFFIPNSLADDTRTILIVPLELNAQKDLAYLKQGISDMLTSRLMQEEKIVIAPKNIVQKAVDSATLPLTPESAAELGKKFSADYVVYGSVTLFGESVSTDARMIDVKENRMVVQFNQIGQSRNELIPHIDALAGRIKTSVIGQNQPTSSPSEDLQRHPKKPPQRSGNQPAPARTPAKRQISRKYPMEIRGLATGDVTGDKQQEIVFIDQNNIFIHRAIENRLQRIGEIKEKAYNNFLALDVADINQNGRAEIFVTNLPQNSNRLHSFVIEYDGKTYRRIVDKERIFISTLQKPDGTRELIGQKHDYTINTMGINQIFEGKVFKLLWENGHYLPTENPALPRGANVYNFTRGDFLHNGYQVTLQYDGSQVLYLFGNDKKEQWSAEESFGSLSTYLELPDSQKKEFMDRYYLPTRLIPVDFDQDGKLDVMVIKNKESLSGVNRIKLFKNGRLACLSWDGLNFQPIWQSETVSKYISDFALADLSGQGQREAIYAVVAKNKSSLSNGQSYIVRQPIGVFQ